MVAAALPNTDPPWLKPELCPKAGVLLWPKRPPPAVAEGCPKEKELVVLVLDGAPKACPPQEADAVDEAAWPKAGVAPKAAWLKVKPLDVFAGWPKAGACPKAGWLKPPVPAAAKADVLNPVPVPWVVVPWVVAVEVDVGMGTGWPNREDAVVAVESWPKTGAGVAPASVEGWLNAELGEELETGGCTNTEELEEATVNAREPVVGAWREMLEEEGGVLAASAGGEATFAGTEVTKGCWSKVETGGDASAFKSLDVGVGTESLAGAAEAEPRLPASSSPGEGGS